MFWKKCGLISIVLLALGIVAYAQSTRPPRAHSSNLQTAMSAGYLGVGVQDLNPERAKAINIKEPGGVEVKTVTPEAPASKVGIRVGDVILEVNGQKVEGQEQFAETISGKTPGTKVALTVSRNGIKQTFSAVLAMRPPEGLMIPGPVPNSPMPGGPMSPEQLQALLGNDLYDAMTGGNAPRVGFEGEPLTAQLAEFFGVSQGEGVLVRTVIEKSPSEKAGLKAGDVIIKVNGMHVASSREIAAIVRQTRKIVFTVIRNKKEMTLNVEVAWNSASPFERDGMN